MSPKKKPSKLKKIFNSNIFLIVLAILTILVVFSATRAIYRDYMVDKKIAKLQNKVDDLNQEKLESMKLLEYVSSKGFAKKKARSQLNMKKPGEKVAIIKNKDKLDKNKEAIKVDSKDKQKKISNPVKWFNYFFRN